ALRAVESFRQSRLEARRANPCALGSGWRDRRLALRHEHEPGHEGPDRAWLLRYGDTLFLVRAPGRANEAAAAAARATDYPSFRWRSHVLHLGRIPPRLPRLGRDLLSLVVTTGGVAAGGHRATHPASLVPSLRVRLGRGEAPQMSRNL